MKYEVLSCVFGDGFRHPENHVIPSGRSIKLGVVFKLTPTTYIFLERALPALSNGTSFVDVLLIGLEQYPFKHQ